MITAIVLGVSLYTIVVAFVVGMCRAASAGDRQLPPRSGDSAADPSRGDVNAGQMPARRLPRSGLEGLRLPQPSLETVSPPGTVDAVLIQK
jgi:hypothetical protein